MIAIIVTPASSICVAVVCRVRGAAFFQEHFWMFGSCDRDVFFINLLNTGNAHLRMGLAGKNAGFQPAGLSSFLQVQFQENSSGSCNHAPAGFVPLSGNCQLIEVFLDQEVPGFEVADFLCPGSAGIHQIQKNLARKPSRFSGSGSLRFLVDIEHPRSASTHFRNPSMVSKSKYRERISPAFFFQSALIITGEATLPLRWLCQLPLLSGI